MAEDIYGAALVGDDARIAQFIAGDPNSATSKGGPRDMDALTYLCFSPHLPDDPNGGAGFVRGARILLDAGANPNTGYYDSSYSLKPMLESVLYGAAGIAHHAELTKLLVERGADVNDEEVTYHSPEGYDNDALAVLLDSDRLTADSLATMLVRKADWHDHEGMALVLAHGGDATRSTRWGNNALEHALLRDNQLATIELLLDHGARADAPNQHTGVMPVAIAARRGRGDALALFEQRAVHADLSAADALIAACARGDHVAVQQLAARDPAVAARVIADGGRLLAQFAGNGNTGGVRELLDLGVDVAARFREGDGYFEVAKDSTALHVAAWRGEAATVKLLLERAAPEDAADGQGRTALMRAEQALAGAYWKERKHAELEEIIELLARPAR